jgi:prevent-host-death family protein
MVMLPLSDVKARLSEIAEEVDRTHERVHITRNGREYVVLVAADSAVPAGDRTRRGPVA